MIKSQNRFLIAVSFVYLVYILLSINYFFVSDKESLFSESSFNNREFVYSFLLGQSVLFGLNFIIYSSITFNLRSIFKTQKYFIPFDINPVMILLMEFVGILKNKFYLLHLIGYLFMMCIFFDQKGNYTFLFWIFFSLTFQIIGLVALIFLRFLFNYNHKGKKIFESTLYLITSMSSTAIIMENEVFLSPLYPIIKLPFYYFIGLDKITIILSLFMVIIGIILFNFRLKKRLRFD